MLCKQCGNENPINAQFCIKCGSRLLMNSEITNSENVDLLYKRIIIFLEEHDWNSAQMYCEQILDIDPENEKAYLGKLLLEFRVADIDDLLEGNIPIDGSIHYQRLMRYGSDELKRRLEVCNRQILDKIKESKRQEIYNVAVQDMKWATTVGEYKAVIDLFKPILGYKDVDELIEKCKIDIEQLEKRNKKRIIWLLIIGVILLFVWYIFKHII